MQTKLNYLLVAALCACCWACSDDDEPAVQPEPEADGPVSVAETSLDDVVAEGTTLSVQVNGGGQWTASTTNAWATPQPSADGATLSVAVEENLWQDARSATIRLTGEDGSTDSVVVRQNAYAYTEGHRYKLPVVFHMFYNRDSNDEVYFPEGHLQTLLDGVNRLYAECGVDLGMEFVMATEDPEGNRLEEPGVDRVQTQWFVLNPEQFMLGQETHNTSSYWDPSKYVNIFLFKYADDYRNVLGISQFPLLPAPYELEGISTYPAGTDFSENPFPQAVCINSTYLYDLPANDNEYYQSDPIVTLAHELGHFIGLYHAFNQDDYGNDCDYDTDYCTDTPPYRKDLYDAQFNSWLATVGYRLLLTAAERDEWVWRINSETGEQFQSHNVMDYAVCYSDQFSPQQAERARYILSHSVDIPGPKDFTGSVFPEAGTRNATAAEDFEPHFTVCEALPLE